MQEVLDAIKDWLVRYFDSKSIPFIDDDMEFIKIQLAIEKNKSQQLIDFILALNRPLPEVHNEQDYQPITSGFEPSRVKRARLQNESKRKAEDIKRASALKVEESKSTQQLEKELGVEP